MRRWESLTPMGNISLSRGGQSAKLRAPSLLTLSSELIVGSRGALRLWETGGSRRSKLSSPRL